MAKPAPAPAADAAPAPEAAPPVKSSGGLVKKILLALIVLLFVLGLVVGAGVIGVFYGKHLIGASGGGSPVEEETAQEEPVEHKDKAPELHDPILVDNAQPPVYIELPPYVKNLDPAEGERFVQAKIVLQVATDPKYSAMIEARKPQINDIINRILATKKPSDIRTAQGQEALSQEILGAVNDALGYGRPAQPIGPWGPVIAVLFNSLIIQ